MANKDEYFMRIIASLQSEITSLKTGQSEAIKEFLALKSTVARQQKEIEALKASQGVPRKSIEPQQNWITTENLLLAVKRVCDDVILKHYEKLPTMFADRQEFEDFRKSIEQKYIVANTFTTYHKAQEIRLKSIEDRLGKGFCLFAINFYDQKQDKGYRSIFSGLRNLKDVQIEGFLPFLAFLFIAMFAVYFLRSITN